MNGDKYRKTYKVCESMSKRMVIVKQWVNGDKYSLLIDSHTL
jgi:hypothetical protein